MEKILRNYNSVFTTNHQNVLFQASFPCDITQQPVVWAEISQGNCGWCIVL